MSGSHDSRTREIRQPALNQDSAPVVTRSIEHGSELYQQALALRQRVLGNPLGIIFEGEWTAGENEQTHIVCLTGRKVIGSVTIRWETTPARVRQMCVDDAWRRKGIGAQLLAHAESIARQRGIATLDLHAQAHAIAFYESCGYQIVSEEYLEVGIQHRTMAKQLSDGGAATEAPRSPEAAAKCASAPAQKSNP